MCACAHYMHGARALGGRLGINREELPFLYAMSIGAKAYLPFRGLSAWFSSSVRPCMAKKWGTYIVIGLTNNISYVKIADEFGGCFSTEEKADFLFSDNSYSTDTVR